MKTVSLSGSPRENVGKKDAKKHRREGNIPCVLYGGEKQIHFVTNEIKFDKGQLLFTRACKFPLVFVLLRHKHNCTHTSFRPTEITILKISYSTYFTENNSFSEFKRPPPPFTV